LNHIASLHNARSCSVFYKQRDMNFYSVSAGWRSREVWLCGAVAFITDHPMTSCTTDSQEGAGRLTSTHPACIGHPHLPLFQGSCFAIPSFIMRVPWSFLEATIWTMLVYWLVGFSPSVSHDGRVACRNCAVAS